MGRQRLELLRRVLRRREADELHLVELVDADHAARILSRGAGLAPEARRVGRQRARQRSRVDDLAAEQIRDGHFSGRDEKEIILGTVGIVLKLRQLPGAGHRLARDEERHGRLFVPMLARVQIEHERHQRAHQPRPAALEHDEARARNFRARPEVEDPELLTDLPMRTHALRGSGLAPRAHDAVVLFAAIGNIAQRHVGDLHEDLVQLTLYSRELELERRDIVSKRAGLRDQLIGVFLCPLAPRDFLGSGVARRLSLVGALDQRAPIAIERLGAVDTRGQRIELKAAAHPLTQRLQVVPQ